MFLQIISIISSVLLFTLVLNMVRIGKIELRYAMTWITAGLILIFLSIFPSVLKFVSCVLDIKEEINTLLLLIILFLSIKVFTLTISLSRNANKIKTLVQEIGLLKQRVDILDKLIKYYKQNTGI